MKKIWIAFCEWRMHSLDKEAKKYLRQKDYTSYYQAGFAYNRWLIRAALKDGE